MRSARLVSMFAVFAGACGGGGFVPRSDGGSNHLPDFAGTVVDLATNGMPPDFSTGGSPDLTSDVPPDFTVLRDMTVPPDLAPPGQCLSPADCPFNEPVCCADVTIGNGQIPLCPIQAVVASCQPSCATNLPFQCPANAVAALCQQAADCQDVNYPYCCLMQNGGTPITACVDTIYKMFVATQCF